MSLPRFILYVKEYVWMRIACCIRHDPHPPSADLGTFRCGSFMLQILDRFLKKVYLHLKAAVFAYRKFK